MAQPVNLKIQCPHCQFDVWVTGNIGGCMNASAKRAGRHSFNIKSVIATQTTVKPSESNAALLQRSNGAENQTSIDGNRTKLHTVGVTP